jgi:general secretion pathway protein L
MSEFLIIHYKPSHESNLQYWAMGADNHPSITLGHGNLEELTAIARGKKVSVLIDAHYTSLNTVNIPSKSRSKQLQAVPFAMEDYLAEDIEDMHFALGKSHTENSSTDGANNLPVIAIKRSLLQQTINTFNEQQIHLEIISADSVALPGSSSNWSILLDEDSALIKINSSQAHSCDRENLPVILQALLHKLSENEQVAPDTINYYYKEDDAEAETLLSECEIKIEPHCYKNHALEIFVQNLKTISSFNLLQGEFTPVRESNIWLKPWKSAAIAASVFLVLQLGNSTMLASQLEQKNLKLTRQIETEFKRAIPDSRNMTNMKIRVERRLNDLKGGGSGDNKNGFLQILSKVSPSLTEQGKVDIQAAVFRNNYIDVDLTAKSLQDIENIKNKLAAIPGIKTVLSTTVEKDSIKGRLRLESKG